jgi:hypothetical protein
MTRKKWATDRQLSTVRAKETLGTVLLIILFAVITASARIYHATNAHVFVQFEFLNIFTKTFYNADNFMSRNPNRIIIIIGKSKTIMFEIVFFPSFLQWISGRAPFVL